LDKILQNVYGFLGYKGLTNRGLWGIIRYSGYEVWQYEGLVVGGERFGHYERFCLSAQYSISLHFPPLQDKSYFLQ
jgi:hypothetical protein